jgi:hypothetical protein
MPCTPLTTLRKNALPADRAQRSLRGSKQPLTFFVTLNQRLPMMGHASNPHARLVFACKPHSTRNGNSSRMPLTNGVRH